MKTSPLHAKRAQDLVTAIFEDDLHVKRVFSLANAVLGCLHAAALAIHAIGLGLARSKGLQAKHTVKQVDRLVSNLGLQMPILMAAWVRFCVANRPNIMLALDWTDFDADGHATLALNMITRHGRATPLMWRTVRKDTLKGNRNDYEDALLNELMTNVADETSVTVLADRGFGDTKFLHFLAELGIGYIVRFRQSIYVTDEHGEKRAAIEWLSATGRAKIMRNVALTGAACPVPAIALVRAPGMREAWCLAVSDPQMSASVAVAAYGKRFTIEENFRDTKDAHFGMGMSELRISRTDRRDRLLLISALSVALLTLLGSAGEATGLDMKFKANTVKTRTHSLFRQGCMYYDCLATMRDSWRIPLLEQYDQILRDHIAAIDTFGVL